MVLKTVFIYTFQPNVIRYHTVLKQYPQSAPYTSVEFVITSLKCAISNKVLLSPVIRIFYYGEYHSCRDNKNLRNRTFE